MAGTTTAPGGRSRGGALKWVVVVLVAALVGAVIAVVVVRATDSSAGASVHLLPADEPGPDPFTPTVASTTAATTATTAPDTVRTGDDGLVASGTAPGLYGGSGDVHVCDPDKLVRFLAANPSKARAWAGVLGISPAGIERYVATLTPVVLTHDTLVVNHGYANGAATSMTAVLQAGTAVMVDRTGAPRVKCNCGNPLTTPEVIDLSAATFSGPRWVTYRPAQVVYVRPGRATSSFTLVDTTTGERYTETAGTGGGGGGTGAWVATLYTGGQAGDAETTVLTSTDGTTWATAATLPGEAVRAVAWADGRWLGVSSTYDVVGTHVLASTDAKTWNQVASVPDADLTSLARGDGRWVATGLHWLDPAVPGGISHSEPVTYTSTDGVKWSRGTIAGVDAANGSPFPVTFGDDAFTTVVTSNQFGGDTGSSDFAAFTYTSSDGSTWKKLDGQAQVNGDVALAHGDDTYVLGSSGASPLQVSADASAWSPVTLPGAEEYSAVDAIGAGNGRFLAATHVGAGATESIVASSDGRTWSAVGDLPVEGNAFSIAYGRVKKAGTTTASTSTTTAGSPPCTREALQDVFSHTPEDDLDTAILNSYDPPLCAGGWAAVHYGNQGMYPLAVFRADGSTWRRLTEAEYQAHEPDPQPEGEALNGYVEHWASLCTDPSFPEALHPYACPAG